MDLWDWVEDYQRQALERGDIERARLPLHHNEAYSYRETDPDRAMALLEEGSRQARALNEPWWVLFYEDWRVTCMLFFQRDYRRVLEAAVQNTLEVRKPAYAHFPMRISVQRNLVESYIGIEPAAYVEPIEQALTHLETEVSEEGDDKYLILGSRREFALEMDWLDQAEAAARRALAIADADPIRSNATHHATFNHVGLCEIAWKRGDQEMLAEVATEGEPAARESGLMMELAELILWQAVAARQGGDEEKARRLARQAASRAGRLQMPPTRAFYEALVSYHTLGGEPARVLQARRRELEAIVGKGRLGYEARTRVHVCRLLAALGEPPGEDMIAAREAARRVRDPRPYLDELNAIEKGNAV
jgi:hypothetical protein